MPKYEYSCNSCENVVEVERSITEEEVVPSCSACGAPTKRVWNSAATHFKGNGWGGTYGNFKPKGNGID